LRSNLTDAGLDDDDDAIDAIRYAWEDHAAERDDSSVADLFASYDRCELLFRFSAERWLDDALVFSHRPWPETSELAITANLQFALNNLGYTIGEFRKASGNRHPADSALPRHARGGARRSSATSSLPKSSTMPARPPSSSASTRSCRSRS
jgi:hypothetical protein